MCQIFSPIFLPRRSVPHVLLNRPPRPPLPKQQRTFDLHVLGTPPAFVLSQDQTRRYVVERSQPGVVPGCCTHMLELTETASTNSCCTVFHSSIVKVPRSMGCILRLH